MKRLLLFLNLLLAISQIQADNYKILYINDHHLKYINGKRVKVGDVFSDVYDIKWEKEEQAVKAINTSTKKQILFVGKKWMKKKGFEALLHNRHLSTHDRLDDNADLSFYDKLLKIFDDQYDILDSIEIETEVELSDSSYFLATYDHEGKKITKRLKNKGRVVIFDNSLFNFGEDKKKKCDVSISIDFVDEKTNLLFFVKDNIELTFYPAKIE